jgi:hypothetical protein
MGYAYLMRLLPPKGRANTQFIRTVAKRLKFWLASILIISVMHNYLFVATPTRAAIGKTPPKTYTFAQNGLN